jgi:hypothetical protein
MGAAYWILNSTKRLRRFRFRRIVGHELQTDRTVVEYGLEFEHCAFYQKTKIPKSAAGALRWERLRPVRRARSKSL